MSARRNQEIPTIITLFEQLLSKWNRVLGETDELLALMIRYYQFENQPQNQTETMRANTNIIRPDSSRTDIHSEINTTVNDSVFAQPGHSFTNNGSPSRFRPQQNESSNIPTSPVRPAANLTSTFGQPAMASTPNPTLNITAVRRNVEQLNGVIEYLSSLRDRACTATVLGNRSSDAYRAVTTELTNTLQKLRSSGLLD